jgi:hypothetical protein
MQLFGLPGFIVQSNLVGVGADRTTNLGNHGDGIVVSAKDMLIGGSFTYQGHTFSAGNVIAFNEGIGIKVRGNLLQTGYVISRNSIYQNGDLGIDLEPLGVTANDFCDFDTGPNALQNFPVITRITEAFGGGLTIQGFVSGELPTYTIELFDNEDCDPSGNGEGRRFIASTTTNIQLPLCKSLFSVTLPNITRRHLSFVTATATSPDGTSEFSQCFSAN